MKTPMEHLEQAFNESNQVRDHFFQKNKEKLIEASHEMATALLCGHKVILMGNGGSSSDALHMAGELTGRMMKDRRPLPAIVLGSNLASMTAIANDYSYEDVFEREMRALARPKDFVIAISTSGFSPNVIHAANYALNLGCYVLALTGKSGGKLKEYCSLNLCVSEGKNAARIQETHIFILHSLVDLMDEFLLV